MAKDYPHEKYGELFENSGIRFTLINPYGKVEFDSQNISREDYMDNHLDRKEVEEALNVGAVSYTHLTLPTTPYV